MLSCWCGIWTQPSRTNWVRHLFICWFNQQIFIQYQPRTRHYTGWTKYTSNYNPAGDGNWKGRKPEDTLDREGDELGLILLALLPNQTESSHIEGPWDVKLALQILRGKWTCNQNVLLFISSEPNRAISHTVIRLCLRGHGSPACVLAWHYRWAANSTPTANNTPREAADRSTLHLFSAFLPWILADLCSEIQG